MRNPIGGRTLLVLGTVAMYKATGITTQQLTDALELPLYVVRNSLEVLKKHRKIKKGGHTGNAGWWIPSDAPMLQDKQTSRKVRTKVEVPPRTAVLVAPTRIAWTMPKVTPPITYTNAAARETLCLAHWEPARAEASNNVQYGSMVNGEVVPYRAPGCHVCGK